MASEASPSQPSPGEPLPSEPIPRSVSTRRLITVVLGIVVALYLGSLVGPPIGAGLQRVWSAVAGPEHEDKQNPGGQHYYTCGMHPWVIVPHPGDCPICGMKLVPLDPAKFSGEVTIDPTVSQNIGVRVEQVEEGSQAGSIRTVGTVTYDETLLGDVNVKVSGWIEKLYVDYLGAPVRRGQPLFELYSPDLYAAQGEYLLAFKATRRTASGDGTTVGGFASELLEPARTKLALYDIGPAQIKAIEASGKPKKTMTIVSPQKGVVTEKHAFEGMNVTPGMTAFRIADLSRVWVMATLYEYQSRDIKVGQPATMALTYLPGQAFEGRVAYVYPFLDQKTRQINVRLEFPNPELALKPGMYATVVLEGTRTDRRPLVPRSAVIDTGERQVAFVALGKGRFEPRRVSMGAQTDDGKVEILSGLKPGELVVTSGQFLIDSEARMREALARMMKGTPVAEATAPKVPETESAAMTLPDAAATALGTALDAYLAAGQALARDTTANIGVSARKLADAIDALVAMPIEGQPHFWHQHPEAEAAKEHAVKLAAPSSLAEARSAYALLSTELSKLLHATGLPKAYRHELQDFHCPMYPQGKEGGSVWIQPAGTPRNPYFGSAMLTCSDWQRPFEVAP
ncbi:MAG: efflux RND transporter periplasmic adaptor subunit [Polyangiaceae bacterium]|nr:efflux RND transporter periplasmic adaptor subunit [Polyangiaceae bacterium]